MKLREVMRRVINYSTMGVDMSKLFTPVIMVRRLGGCMTARFPLPRILS